MNKPIKPPFNEETALAKVRAAEDAWNSRDPQRVSLAYSEDSEWRNRDQFFRGRDSAGDYAGDQDAAERQKRMDQGAARPRRERTSVRVPGEHDGDVRA